jgi:hypothetical protein
MANVIRDMIEYSGIADEFPQLSYPACFKQLNLQNITRLADAKPDIGQIIKVISDVKIIGSRVIRTPKGTSEEGHILTGKKLIIDGDARLKVEYAAENTNHTVFAEQFSTPFCTSIALPEEFIIGTQVFVQPYIEDIYIVKENNRTVFYNMLILIVADFQ